MGRAKYGIDLAHQMPEENKNVILRSDINKTIYHPTVGKLGMIYYVIICMLTMENVLFL